MTDDKYIIISYYKTFYCSLLSRHRVRYMFYFRICQNSKNKSIKTFCEYKLYWLCRKYGIEIRTSSRIGSGFVMTHPIGDDVMIAPNTFVNCDIPSHSVVIGNLCKVFSKDNATKQYV